MTGRLGGNHKDVQFRRWLDLTEVNVEAVRKREGVAFIQVGGDILQLGLSLFLIGDQDHHDIGHFGCLRRSHDLEAIVLCYQP